MPDPLASRKVLAACLAVIAVGFARLAYVNWPAGPRGEERSRPAALEEALRAVAAAIPPGVRVGYVARPEEPNPFEDLPYVVSTYALAPRVVVRGTDGVRWVLAFHDDDAGLAALRARHGLVPVASAPGVTLTVREHAP